MHPEHIHTAISAAAVGDSVAIFGETVERVQDIARDIVKEVPADYVERVSRLNGAHRIDFHGGGRIRFISLRQSARGLSLDRAYVPIPTDRDILASIIPSLNASAGVLTGY